MQKYIKEVFSDYNGENSIVDAELENINLYKKTNKLQVNIATSKAISITEIEDFENYLVYRFKVSKAIIDINYGDTILPQNIEENWKNIINYIAKKEPTSKAMLNGSTLNIGNEEITVNLALKGANFLIEKKFDKGLEHLLENLYNKKYTVVFKENLSENYEKDLEEKKKQEEKILLEEMQKQAEEEYLIAKEEARLKKLQEEKEKQEEYERKVADLPELKEDTVSGQAPLIFGRNIIIDGNPIKVKDIDENSGKVCIDGELAGEITSREIKNEKILTKFSIFDGTSTITCVGFFKKPLADGIINRIKLAKALRIDGISGYNDYDKEIEITINRIIETEGVEKIEREDTAEQKRVELHMHTQMSQMDAVTPVTDLLKRAIKWGWKSIAITDHGVVQSFPEAHKYLTKSGADLKVLYGVEAYFVPDKDPCVVNYKGQPIDTEYCILDLETTGFSCKTEKITEIGVIKYKNGEQIGEFECFVNPEKPIPEKVVEVTHITDDMVKDAETIDKVLPKLIEFLGDSVLVAHNADFDMGFLKYNFEKYGYKFDYTSVDTLRLAKAVFPDFKKYKLGIIADNLGIKVDVAHRALDDVKTLLAVFKVMIEETKKVGGENVIDFEDKFETDPKKMPTYHAIILAKNYIGLRNLYKLISFSHLDYFYRHPRILKSLFSKYREGLILGSACEAGELYRSILENKSDEEIEEIAKFYDYLEIQPIGNDKYLIREGTVADEEGLMDINRKIVALGEKLNKPVVATCDVHFMDPQDEVYRRILQAGQGYDDADYQAPLFLRTTEEMLEEFEYLGKEKAYEVVVKNTNLIADMCEKISPISPEKCAPHIPGCEETIKEIAYSKAYELYGDPLPEIVKTRLDKELDSIIKNGFSVMYIIAQKLVWKSNEDGYLVGSRGSVGSSFVANMTGITEVNSLQPHYRCPNCKFSDFSDYGVKNGFDLPDKDCPKCGHKLDKDGMDIPFETFLGFNGDKEPDIDLNFSGEYQAKAHKYTEVIFGKGTTFKAGTVGTIADKTAFGYVKKYHEERNKIISKAETERLAVGCTGIKRTTGQHPGGIIVVPKGREIYEFCPVQHPADDPNSDIITTHFDYHSIDQNLLKLDILGHDDPTMIRMLQDITGIDPTKIPLDDKETMSLFSSTKALGVTEEQIGSKTGSFGVPEFGTKFVRGMLEETKPTTFAELISISGLSHGTDVWLNNAQEIIHQGIVTLNDAICCRDDIMIYLIKMGLEPNPAFKIMESVRKGKGLTPEQEGIMKAHDVPDWYIESCKKIKYMFPKAHAAAYVTMAFRIAWFKVHIPLAYYATYFSIRAKQFDSEIMCAGKARVKAKMKEIDEAGNAAANKDKEMYPVLELVLEMYERGFKFLDIDLYKSHHDKFIVEEDGIRPPLNSIPGLGPIDAESIFNSRQEGEFECVDDLQARSKIGKVAIETLQKAGLLKGMTKSNQMSLFSF